MGVPERGRKRFPTGAWSTRERLSATWPASNGVMGRARGHDGERGRWGSDSFTLGTVSVPPQGDGCGAAAGYPVCAPSSRAICRHASRCGVARGRCRTRRRAERTTCTPSLSSRSRSQLTWVRAQAVRAARSRSSCRRPARASGCARRRDRGPIRRPWRRPRRRGRPGDRRSRCGHTRGPAAGGSRSPSTIPDGGTSAGPRSCGRWSVPSQREDPLSLIFSQRCSCRAGTRSSRPAPTFPAPMEMVGFRPSTNGRFWVSTAAPCKPEGRHSYLSDLSVARCPPAPRGDRDGRGGPPHAEVAVRGVQCPRPGDPIRKSRKIKSPWATWTRRSKASFRRTNPLPQRRGHGR